VEEGISCGLALDRWGSSVPLGRPAIFDYRVVCQRLEIGKNKPNIPTKDVVKDNLAIHSKNKTPFLGIGIPV